MFHKLHLRERINRRTLSQGPYPLPSFWPPPPKLRSGKILQVERKSNWFDGYCARHSSFWATGCLLVLVSEGWWWCSIPSLTFLPRISLEAQWPKDFYGIPDYLGKYPSSFLLNRIQSVPKSVLWKAWANIGVQCCRIASSDLNVRIHQPQISAFMLLSNLPKSVTKLVIYIYFSWGIMFCCECLFLPSKKLSKSLHTQHLWRQEEQTSMPPCLVPDLPCTA